MIVGDRIQAVGPRCDAPDGTLVLDARGRVICPGFIDAHGHSDFHLLISPGCESKVHQGITTEIIGNCGLSAAPLSDRNRSETADRIRDRGIEPNWTSFAEYLARVRQLGISMNIVPLIGHGTARGAVVGYAVRPLADEEKQDLCRQIDQARDEGARGLSSGLEYPPGCFADIEELSLLARRFRQSNGIYTTHVRDEGRFLLKAIDEALEVARRAEVKLQISHFKVCGRSFWGQLDKALERLEHARQQGACVRFDRYPYLAVSTHLAIYLPPELWEGGTEQFLQRLLTERSDWETLLRESVEEQTTWDGILITDARGAAPELNGKSLEEIATDRGTSPEVAAVDLLLESRGKIQIAAFQMNEEETEQILAHPLCFHASDASLYAPEGVLAQSKPHPRSYGSAARFLCEYIYRRKIDTPESAIHRMTGAPAEFFGVRDRGRITVGAVADVVVFDPTHLRDTAQFGDPHHYPEGIDRVIVNGTVVVDHGRHTGKRPGRIL